MGQIQTLKSQKMKQKKMLIFHSALAPYRIDQFNFLGKLFDLEVVFYLNNLANFKYDQNYLKEQCNFKISYLLRGPGKTDRFFRFGVFNKVKKTKPDLILSYEYSLTTHYLLLLKSLGLISQKVGTMVDDSLDICYNPRSKARLYSRKFALKKLDYIVLLSNVVSEFYITKLNMKENQTIVFPLLQLPERLRSNITELELRAKEYQDKYKLYGKKVLLYIGRFAPEKHLPSFISNVYDILQKDKDLVFVMIGEGAEKDAIVSVIKERGLEEKVIFSGRFEADELFAWYLCGSGMVLPSISETYGAVVNEALIFGTPVLCSELAGASTLIDSNNGRIFDPLSQRDTREKTSEFLSEITPVTDIDLLKRESIMNCHPDDFTQEWDKINV